MVLEFQKNMIYAGLNMFVVYFNIVLANLVVPILAVIPSLCLTPSDNHPSLHTSSSKILSWLF